MVDFVPQLYTMDCTDNFNTDLFKAIKKLEEVRKGKTARKGEVLLSESRERRYHRGAQGGNDLQNTVQFHSFGSTYING